MTPEQVDRQIYMLRRNCGWQRSQGTKRDNGYPYGKHLPDCDICRSAELITQLQEQNANYKEQITALVKEKYNLTDVLSKAIKDADGWHDDGYGGPSTNMDKYRHLIEVKNDSN